MIRPRFHRAFVLKATGFALILLVVGLLAWKLWKTPHENARPRSLPLTSIGAELLLLDGASIVRRGPTNIVVVRFLQPMELRPYHFRADNMGTALTIEAWASRLGAPVVFNAGQFDEGFDYLGWLKRDGRWLSDRRKNIWKGLLVSGPIGDVFWGRIVDLDHADADIADHYQHVVQSMMLVDANSRLRVRDTDLSACRTVIAEDTRGRILIIVTEGATTLGDLARWLIASPLDVMRAMNLDGGIESQLALDTPELKLTLYGQYGTGATAWNPGGGQVRYPLPAVVAVRPYTPPPSQ
jgi:hypothetical protein